MAKTSYELAYKEARMQNNLSSGILLMILTMFVFASQDGISRHLASTYNVEMVVMVRYWFLRLSFFGRQRVQRAELRLFPDPPL